MSERIKCKWCCGTGTIPASGYTPAHRCPDCGGKGWMNQCQGCGSLVAWDEGVVIKGEMWCFTCNEQREEEPNE